MPWGGFSCLFLEKTLQCRQEHKATTVGYKNTDDYSFNNVLGSRFACSLVVSGELLLLLLYFFPPS